MYKKPIKVLFFFLKSSTNGLNVLVNKNFKTLEKIVTLRSPINWHQSSLFLQIPYGAKWFGEMAKKYWR